MEWKKLPSRIPEDAYFGLPNRVRALLARLVGAEPEDIALTTGASTGLAAVAWGLEWKPEDEVLLMREEFPAHFSVFLPLGDAGRARVKVIQPEGRFPAAGDFLKHIGPRTRLVSTSVVRFNDAVRMDIAPIAQACRSVGAWLVVDASQAVGALPLSVKELGADVVVASGYKWLLGPFGTGFFWIRRERVEELRPGPFYWMGARGMEQFHSFGLEKWEPVPGARRWDTPETASFYNLAALEASLELVLRAGPETVRQHNDRLLRPLVEQLPRDRCVLASPGDPAARGTYVCIAGRSPEKTQQLYEKLTAAGVITSLRQDAIRIAPYLYNSERNLDRLRMALTA
jgi:selenocysteine lyase/cysteine desulfurase